MTQIQPGVIGSTTTGGAVAVTIVGNSTLGNGSKTVTTAGTRVQLSDISIPCKKVTIQGLVANTNAIYVGDSSVSSSNGYVLYATQSFTITPNNLNLVYLDAAVSGEGVTYLYEN